MKKRFFSVLLCIVLLLPLIPMTTFAAEMHNVTINVPSGATFTIAGESDSKSSGEAFAAEAGTTVAFFVDGIASDLVIVATADDGTEVSTGGSRRRSFTMPDHDIVITVSTEENPNILGGVSISGSGLVGETLTASYLEGNVSDPVFTWSCEGTQIATGTTFTPTDDYIGKELKVRVTSESGAKLGSVFKTILIYSNVEYTLTFSMPKGGTVEYKGTDYSDGQSVNVSAGTECLVYSKNVPEGCTFDTMTLSNGGEVRSSGTLGRKFVMPSENVTLTYVLSGTPTADLNKCTVTYKINGETVYTQKVDKGTSVKPGSIDFDKFDAAIKTALEEKYEYVFKWVNAANSDYVIFNNSNDQHVVNEDITFNGICSCEIEYVNEAGDYLCGTHVEAGDQYTLDDVHFDQIPAGKTLDYYELKDGSHKTVGDEITVTQNTKIKVYWKDLGALDNSKKISSITISGITKPAVGVEAGIVDPSTLTVNNSNVEITNAEWFTAANGYTRGVNFAGDTYYYLKLELKVTNGYWLANPLTINNAEGMLTEGYGYKPYCEFDDDVKAGAGYSDYDIARLYFTTKDLSGELPYMTGVSLDAAGVLHWNAVDGAAKYKIGIGTLETQVAGLSYDVDEALRQSNKVSGGYTISVYAVDGAGNPITKTKSISYRYTGENIELTGLTLSSNGLKVNTTSGYSLNSISRTLTWNNGKDYSGDDVVCTTSVIAKDSAFSEFLKADPVNDTTYYYKYTVETTNKDGIDLSKLTKDNCSLTVTGFTTKCTNVVFNRYETKDVVTVRFELVKNPTYTVKYEYFCGESSVTPSSGAITVTKTVNKGTKISKPTTVPVASGKMFVGYYTDKTSGVKFDFENTEINSNTVIYGKFVSHPTHSFDKEVVADAYLKTPADCTHKAVYYKSCECGACGIETFESGEFAAHEYDGDTCIHCGYKKPADVTPSGHSDSPSSSLSDSSAYTAPATTPVTVTEGSETASLLSSISLPVVRRTTTANNAKKEEEVTEEVTDAENNEATVEENNTENNGEKESNIERAIDVAEPTTPKGLGDLNKEGHTAVLVTIFSVLAVGGIGAFTFLRKKAGKK